MGERNITRLLDGSCIVEQDGVTQIIPPGLSAAEEDDALEQMFGAFKDDLLPIAQADDPNDYIARLKKIEDRLAAAKIP